MIAVVSVMAEGAIFTTVNTGIGASLPTAGDGITAGPNAIIGVGLTTDVDL